MVEIFITIKVCQAYVLRRKQLRESTNIKLICSPLCTVEEFQKLLLNDGFIVNKNNWKFIPIIIIIIIFLQLFTFNVQSFWMKVTTKKNVFYSI